MSRLTVALATYNEEANLRRCLSSVKNIADEIVIVDGTSSDKTVEIAKEFKAKILVTDNPPIFHINKKKAIDMSTGEWILQLDADEVVSEKLATEIKKVISMRTEELEEYEAKLPKRDLFLRHQKLIEQRDGNIGKDEGEYVAFFLPRLNFYLGRYLRYGGVYPDGVIRLFRNGKAYLPAKDVHEQYVVSGRVGWLANDLLHYDSPTFSKYLLRYNRYTLLIAKEIREKGNGYNPAIVFKFLIFYPVRWFVLTFFRHKGFLDLWQGFVFSFFSSLRFPVGYIKFLLGKDR